MMNSYKLRIEDKDIEDGVFTLSLTLSDAEHNWDNIAEIEARYNMNDTSLNDGLEVDTLYWIDLTIADDMFIAEFISDSLADFIENQIYSSSWCEPKTYEYTDNLMESHIRRKVLEKIRRDK